MNKRILMCGALVVTLATLTGCGNTKTLTCTQENNEGDFPNKQEIVYKFKDNEIVSSTQTTTITIEGENAQYKEAYKNSAQRAVEDYKKDGMSAKLEESNNTISVKVEMEPDKLSESDYILYKMDENYESMKAILTNEGYTCK